MRILTTALLTLLVAACAAPGGGPSPVAGWEEHRARLLAFDHWQAEGKMALRTPGQSESASLVWEQRQDLTLLRLSGPLGVNSTTIRSDGRRMRVERGDETRDLDISSPRAIVESTGWDLPLGALPHWLKGVPAPAGAVEDLQLENALPTGFRQDGWQVTYEDWGGYDGLTLPTRMRIERGETRARLLIRQWKGLSG